MSGLEFRLDSPVENGAAVVCFSFRAFAKPSDSEAFHVSPLQFNSDKRTR